MSAEYTLIFPLLLFADSLELEKDRHILEHQIDNDELIIDELRTNTTETVRNTRLLLAIARHIEAKIDEEA
jgi:hypothetical protein